MTPSRLAVQNFANVTLRRRTAFLLLQNVYYQRLLAAQQKREIDQPFNQSSRRTLKIVEMSTSEICASEFADWTLFEADLGNDDFVEECMALFSVWCAELEEDWSDGWSDVETMTSEECASCGVTRFYPPSADADAVRCTCEEVSSAFTDSDVSSSSSGVSQSALGIPWDLNRPRRLANGRVQYVSMFNENSDYSDCEASFAEQVYPANRRLSFDDCSSSEESLAMPVRPQFWNRSCFDEISSSSSEESVGEDAHPANDHRRLVRQFNECSSSSSSSESVLSPVWRAPSEEIATVAAWTEEKEEKAPIRIYCGMSTGARECLARLRARSYEELELSMSLFAAWTEEKDEAAAEPDAYSTASTLQHDSLLMAALLSTMEESSAASVDLRAASCPDLLMDAARPSRWEDYIYTYPTSESNATPVTSSISQYPMNIETLSARSTVSTSSLFKDPTSASSDASSLSSSDSLISITGSHTCQCDGFLIETMSSRSSTSSSSSSLFKDPTSASSDASSLSSSDSLSMRLISISSSLFKDPTSSGSDLTSEFTSAASDASYCAPCCVPVPFCAHVNRGSTIEEDDVSEQRSVRSDGWHSGTSSDVDEGYETDEDSDPVVPSKTTIAASTQTEETDKASVARMLADCDSILVTVMEMKKKLMEMQ